ncbi:MAG: DUF4229 domain-containing protein [Gordonia sp. (in: high G+C Gram-positive bacteria)]
MSEDSSPAPHDATAAAPRPATMGTLAGWVALYSLVRLGLVVVIAAIIVGVGLAFDQKVPLIVAALFGVLIALPLGMVLFKGIRLKVNEQIAEVDADRAAKRSDLQSRLRGEGE